MTATLTDIFSTLARNAVTELGNYDEYRSKAAEQSKQHNAMRDKLLENAQIALMMPPPPKREPAQPGPRAAPPAGTSVAPFQMPSPEPIVQSPLIHSDPMQLTKQWISYLDVN